MVIQNPDSTGRESTEDVRQAVRRRYGDIAGTGGCGCGPGCCGNQVDPVRVARTLGYAEEDVGAAPAGANMGLGCGNPQAIADLRPGETVLDLGSGGGFDCFLAARRVGDGGRVIGIDMTPEMVARARDNAAAGNYPNVEFRLGEIENLPVADNSVDCIMSNCVINLSPNKRRVFEEAFRVLKPGGRLAVSDIVATAELPEPLKEDLALLTSCIAGASPIPELEHLLASVGFTAVHIQPQPESRSFIRAWAPETEASDYVVSAIIQAVKPV